MGIIRAIILDSTPLGLIANRLGFKPADECRAWLKRNLQAGVRIHVPAIVAYELRRELLRLDSRASITVLNHFLTLEPDRYLPLDENDLLLAAEL